MPNWKAWVAVAAVAWTTLSATAVTPLVPAKTFFESPTFAGPALSPSGTRIAARTRFAPNHYALTVIDLVTNQATVVVKDAKLTVTDFLWKTDNQLVVENRNDDGNVMYHSVDLRTRKSRRIVATGNAAWIANALPHSASDVLFGWSDGSLYRVNINTGTSAKVESPMIGISQWVIDADGTVWAGIGFDQQKWRFIWRSKAGGEWQHRDSAETHLPEIFPLGIMPDHKRLVILLQKEAGTRGLAYFDLATTAVTEIFHLDEVDIGGIVDWGRAAEPSGAIYETDRRHYHFFSAEAEACYRAVNAALPDSDNVVEGFSADNRRAIIRTQGSRDPGHYFLLDRSVGKISVLGPAVQSLEGATLAPSRTFKFQARDGLSISGMITLPTHVERPPLILEMGPSINGPRTYNEYDPIAQYFASRGFAVARLNVRGTVGFGIDFLRAGDLQLTTGLVNDLVDGAAWIAAQGWTDPKRNVLLGLEWGGWVTLHAAAQTNAFQAIVDFDVPMTVEYHDLKEISASDRDSHELEALLGRSMTKSAFFRSLDPARMVSELAIPSFNFYSRQRHAAAMVANGEYCEKLLRKSHRAEFLMYTGPLIEPDTDLAAETGKQFDAATAFLTAHLK